MTQFEGDFPRGTFAMDFGAKQGDITLRRERDDQPRRVHLLRHVHGSPAASRLNGADLSIWIRVGSPHHRPGSAFWPTAVPERVSQNTRASRSGRGVSERRPEGGGLDRTADQQGGRRARTPTELRTGES